MQKSIERLTYLKSYIVEMLWIVFLKEKPATEQVIHCYVARVKRFSLIMELAPGYEKEQELVQVQKGFLGFHGFSGTSQSTHNSGLEGGFSISTILLVPTSRIRNKQQSEFYRICMSYETCG